MIITIDSTDFGTSGPDLFEKNKLGRLVFNTLISQGGIEDRIRMVIKSADIDLENPIDSWEGLGGWEQLDSVDINWEINCPNDGPLLTVYAYSVYPDEGGMYDTDTSVFVKLEFKNLPRGVNKA